MKKSIAFATILSMLAIAVPGATFAAVPVGQIVSPTYNQIFTDTVSLIATYDDGDDLNDDIVQWAVRKDTCDAGMNTVAGNVDGFNDPYSWDGADFSASLDAMNYEPGHYCFVFNPKDDVGEPDVREVQWFYIVDDYVNGGGHALEGTGKRKDLLDFSFGGMVGSAGDAGLVGDWNVVLHNVNADLDGGHFHTTTIDDLSFFTGPSCKAMNFTAHGDFDGMPGYKMTFRAGDSTLHGKNDVDTVRVELWNDMGGKIYDSHWGAEFSDESDCVGTARTGLDTGNITIVY